MENQMDDDHQCRKKDGKGRLHVIKTQSKMV